MKIGIICGGGIYPLLIARGCQEAHIETYLLFVDGHVDKNLQWPDFQFQNFRLGEIARVLDFLKKNKITDIIFAGNIKRPSIFQICPDVEGIKWLTKIGSKFLRGDDELLRCIAQQFEQNGFNVLDGRRFLKNISQNEGVLTDVIPSELDNADIKRGVEILTALSRCDVGQSVIVYNGIVLGIEACEGTEMLIKRCSELKDTQKGGVLIKISKNGQDNRFDMPVIGVNTVKQVKDANLAGIAIEGANCIILENQDVIKIANQLGVFLTSIVC